jgi:integrase
MNKKYDPFLSLDKRDKIWYIYYYDAQNKPKRKSTGCKLQKDAKNYFKYFKPPVVLSTSDTGMTLLTFQSKFRLYAKKKYTSSTQKHFNVAWNQLMLECGETTRIDEIDKEDVQNFLATAEFNASIWTARKYYTALASMFERAKDWKHVNENVWREVVKPKEGEREIIFFERLVFENFITSVSEWDKRLYLFAVHTGMRLSEICNARWQDVDWNKNCIRVVNRPTFHTKNKRSRNIPCNTTLLELMRSLPREGEFIFGYNPDTVSHRFRDYIRNNRQFDQRLHFHSLRHTFASWLVQSHVSLYEVQKLMGHAKISTTEIYAHLLDDTLHDAVNVLDSIRQCA